MQQTDRARNDGTMSLWEILQKSLRSYRANIVLLVPSLVGLVAGFLYSAFPAEAILRQALESGSSDKLLSASSLLSGVELLYWIVGFLIYLGRAAMTGKIVVEGKTALSDWIGGMRRYFFRVLGISLVYYVIARGLNFLITRYVVRSLIVQGLFGSPAFLVSELSGDLLSAIAVSLFWLWLASAILDDNRVWDSLVHGTSVLKNRGRTYVGLVILIFAVSATESLASFSKFQPLVGSLTTMSVLTGVVLTPISPLLFLMAFEIYRS